MKNKEYAIFIFYNDILVVFLVRIQFSNSFLKFVSVDYLCLIIIIFINDKQMRDKSDCSSVCLDNCVNNIFRCTFRVLFISLQKYIAKIKMYSNIKFINVIFIFYIYIIHKEFCAPKKIFAL